MECNQPMLLSSPPSADGELGEFLDGILFSPEGTSLLTDEALLDPNPLDGVADEASLLAPHPMANSHHRQSSQMVSLSANDTASKPSEVLQPAGAKPSPEEKPSEASEPEASKPESLEANSKAHNAAETAVVSLSEVKPKDVLCVRGNGGIHQPGNMMFRYLISSKKAHFNTLSTEEQELFSTDIWLGLSEKGHRFLKPAKSNHYEILDYDRSVRKCHLALRDCRTKTIKKGDAAANVGVAAISDSFDYSQSTNPKPPPNKKQKTGKKTKTVGPLGDKNFDDVARAAISRLLSMPELVNAMEKNWGDDDEIQKRKKLFEEQVLERYRAAACHGMLVDDFTDNLLPILLKDIEVSNDDGKDVNEQ